MNRDSFLRDLKRYCRRNALAIEVDKGRGKGGHYLVTVGEITTTIQSDINEGRAERILKQLGLPKDAL